MIDVKKARVSGAAPPKAGTRTRRPASTIELPDGFGRYTSANDCAVERCTYRLSTTHYHCCRHDCMFGTADKSRLLQHAQRHKKTDGIMGNEFRQVRLAQNCGRADCEHNTKCTHYHCLKCPYICVELSKVQVHRKHHQKQELMSAQGYIKVTASATCSYGACAYSGRTTHYHCRQNNGQCPFAAHGQTQMTSHIRNVHNAP